jgi:sugar O-acyltransferase (sialic acid O-acetyltransferase NeuD family)
VADVAFACGYDKIAFLDDAHDRLDRSLPVLGPVSILNRLADDWPTAIAAVGNNAVRQNLFRKLRENGFQTPAIVHSSAVVSRATVIGEGVFIAPGAVINTGAIVGEASIVNTGALIDHDCMIGTANHVAPGATLSGQVTTGKRVWLGTGCSVRQGVTINDDVLVGVGAAVVSDLTVAGIYTGVPAKLLKQS